ncbi:MAG: type II toxin-antitoxin system PemK/MazF family toxin [Chloroflexi bacterium]|nr:type II toxin-antitoxin system PemK/MazF family toxin [Chloroflexota bacterium]
MKKAGQVVVFHFPQTDLEEGRLRPALLLGKMPGEYDDWLICMISSPTRQSIFEFDEIINDGDVEFGGSGLKGTSVIRVGRLAVVSGEILLGAMGHISSERLNRLKIIYPIGFLKNKTRRSQIHRADRVVYSGMLSTPHSREIRPAV